MLAFGLFLGATTALAQSESDARFRVAARLGYSVPFGDFGGAGLRHDVAHQFPIGLDLGYMVTQHLLVGVYGQYGPGVPGDEEPSDGTNSDTTVGVQAQYHFTTTQRVDPWLGLGIGYEFLHEHYPSSDDEATLELRGFELAKLQAGIDFKISRAFALGPFASCSFGKFTHYAITRKTDGLVSYSQSGGFDPAPLHEWPTIGVKGTFAL
jgi:outer membrane protein W